MTVAIPEPGAVPSRNWDGTRLPIGKQFWNFVARGDGCWEWQRGRTTDGYGEVWADGRSIYVHRYAWIFVNGPIPEGMEVCHRCDNPPCCRPDHLFLGTHKDNMHDRDRKGRGYLQRGGL